MSIKKALPVFATATLVMSFAGAADGALYVYEGFQYEAATSTSDRTGASLLAGQADDAGVTDTDATGLSGTWAELEPANGGANTATDLRMATGSLAFGDLATNGNHVRADSNLNNDRLARTISADLDAGSKLYFSVLASKLDRRGAAQGGIVIGNQVVNNSKVLLDTGSTGLNGFAVASPNGNNWTAYAWDGSTQTVGGANLSIPNADVHLLVGEISFNTGTGGNDVFNLYDYQLNAGSITGGTLSLVTSLEADIDEAGLDTISIARQVNTAYDEIRIADNLDEVLGVPEPGSLALLGLGGLLIARRRRG